MTKMNTRKKHDDYVAFVQDVLVGLSTGRYKLISEEEAQAKLEKEAVALALQKFEEKHGYKRSDYSIAKVDRIENGFKILLRPYSDIVDFTLTVEVK